MDMSKNVAIAGGGGEGGVRGLKVNVNNIIKIKKIK